MSKKARAAISRRMKEYWASPASAKHKRKVHRNAKRQKAESNRHLASEKTLTQKLANDLPWRLTILVQDPNSGQIEKQLSFAETDHELLGSIIDGMYSGNFIHEYRLERL